MNYEIDKEKWSACKICKKTLSEIKKEIGGDGVYFSQAFLEHLKEHNITPSDYFVSLCGCEPILCECGCKERTKIFSHGANIHWKRFFCGRNKGVMKWSEWAKEGRKGEGNPMFGMQSWNTGKTKEDSEILMRSSIQKKESGWKPTEEMKRKASIHCKTRKPHLGCKHSELNIAKFKANTAKKHSEGGYPQTDTKPHREMVEILKEMGIVTLSEVLVICYTFDVFLPEYNIYIEVDGDFFHSNPKFYPKGPISKIQKRNAANDKNKNAFCEQYKMKLLRFWEYDIMNNKQQIMENLKCVLKK
jgi:hypothetical protein